MHHYFLDRDLREYARLVGPSSLVFDIGSGNSPYKSFFHFNNYLSIDITTFNKKIDILGDLCNLPIKSSVADLIILTEVIEHINEPYEVVDEISRLMKDEGYLILTTPLCIGVHDKYDFYRFTEMGIRYLFKNSNFKIIEFNKRGGIFSCLGGILVHIPNQIVVYENKKKLINFLLIYCYYLLLMPLIRLLILLDKADKYKNYTLGYDLLLKKNKK